MIKAFQKLSIKQEAIKVLWNNDAFLLQFTSSTGTVGVLSLISQNPFKYDKVRSVLARINPKAKDDFVLYEQYQEFI